MLLGGHIRGVCKLGRDPVPLFRQQFVVEAAKNLRAFLNLELGLTRGPIPPSREQIENQVQSLTRKLQNVGGRPERGGEQLKQARQQIVNKNRRIAELQRRLDASTAAWNAIGSEEETNDVVDRFHKLYYESSLSDRRWDDQRCLWLGVPTRKCPLDMWVYQEMVFDLEPDVIIETGTARGGSALFLAGICDRVGKGRVVSVDIEERDDRPEHYRIRYISGSSTAEHIVDQVKESVDGGKALVILDSDHSRDHVLDELRIYNQFVSKGSYVIVEDTNVNGHPVTPEFGPGPMEAVEDFLKENGDFVVDDSKEKFFMTFNPRGYLRRDR